MNRLALPICLLSLLAASTIHADTVSLNVAADTFILNSNPDANAGASTWFDAGRDGVGGARRGLLRFDLSHANISGTVTSVVVQLTITRVPSRGPADSTFSLYRLNLPWGEGNKSAINGSPATAGEATWNAAILGSAPWTVPGAASDAEPAASASTPVGSSGGAYTWKGPGLLTDVRHWLANPSSNYGWLLRSEDEITDRTVRGFASRENGSSYGVLTIGFTPSPTVVTNPIVARIPKGNFTVELQTVVDGLASPLGIAVPDDNSGRVFVYDQAGQVVVIGGNTSLAQPLLDVSSRLVQLSAYDERGLLGLAVHPNFAQQPLVYTYTSEPVNGAADFQTGVANDHQSVITEWRISAGNSNVVDATSRRELMRIDEPQSNHNGGTMRFGPDGFLYIALGDGGQANDVGPGHAPDGNAQDLTRIWGKVIRIDVDSRNSVNGNYGIPGSNPFAGGNGLPEIFAYGVRNPFAFSFDRTSGQLYLADVGQNNVEEVDIISSGGNYGWNLREGTFWFESATGNVMTGPVRPVPPGLIDPIAQYDHDDGSAVIGGYVYRGSAIPGLSRVYVFGDWGSFGAPSGRLFFLDATNGVNELRIGTDDRTLGLWLKGFGEGPDGELYAFGSRWLGPSGNTGRMLKLVPAPSPAAVTAFTPVDGKLTSTWTGATGPCAVQKKSSLADEVWMNAAITNGRSAVLAQDGTTAFFRIRDTAHLPPIPFTVFATGAAEHPSNTSPGSAFGIFALDGNTLTFTIAYSGLSGTASAAHIHGPSDTTGDSSPILDLTPYNGGAFGAAGTVSGVAVLTDIQKAYLLAGLTYVNFHTAAFPMGEIRGQIAPVNMQVALSGATEVPPVNSPGSGLGNLLLVGNQLTFNISYRNLGAVAADAHIHGPAAPGQSAPPLTSLVGFNGGAFGTAGSLSGTVTLDPGELAAVIDGLTYVNIHTVTEMNGEIRGQILPCVTGVPFTAVLSGLAEKPTPLTNSASGTGSFSLDGDTLTFNVTYTGLSGLAIGAHIHGPGNSTVSAPIMVDLAPFNGGAFGSSGTVSGSVLLTTVQRNALLTGQTYVNFHTDANRDGEMRGQIAPVSMSAGLNGVNEEPTPVTTPGSGLGTFALVRDQLALVVAYRSLTGTAQASHIHGPASFTGSATVLVNLGAYNGGAYGISGTLSGTVPLTLNQLLNVVDGQTYINFHTTLHGGGEIRGHIMR